MAPEAPEAPEAPAASRIALAVFVLLLVAVAFARAHYASSTGIRLAGDGADYGAIAETMRLEGRAPFVYRPAVPMLVGALFAGNLVLGFALVCAAAMFVALYAAGRLAPDGLAGYGVVALLFFNYQVLFAAANPARLDVVVLAVQLGFVALALRQHTTPFLVLLPLCALLKESLLLSLGALALVALPRRREVWLQAAASAAAFIAVYLLVRSAATPTAYMPPYDGGIPGTAALRQMLAGNLSALAPLHFFVAWGGLCGIGLWLLFAGERARNDALLPLAAALLLLFPLPLVTDVHRAWFELCAPLLLFLLLPRLGRERRGIVYPALAWALVASIIPYAGRFVAGEHLYLLLLEERLSETAGIGVVLALVASATALFLWTRRAYQPSA